MREVRAKGVIVTQLVSDKRARRSAQAEYRQRNHAADLLYAAGMNLASTALQVGLVSRAHALLLRHRRAPGDRRNHREWFWRFLWGQTIEQGTTVLPGHRGLVFTAQFSEDGTWWFLATIRDR